MKCTDCEHFNILYPPYRSGGILWDTGRAECTKYKLEVDTVSRKQIDRLVCVETQAVAKLRENNMTEEKTTKQTNYEKIKSMSIDEMALLFCKGDFGCEGCAGNFDKDICASEHRRIKAWLNSKESLT